MIHNHFFFYSDTLKSSLFTKSHYKTQILVILKVIEHLALSRMSQVVYVVQIYDSFSVLTLDLSVEIREAAHSL